MTRTLLLDADNSFSPQKAGQTYRGTFVVNGNIVELNIRGGPKTTATIHGNNLTYSTGQIWTLSEQSAGTAPSESNPEPGHHRTGESGYRRCDYPSEDFECEMPIRHFDNRGQQFEKEWSRRAVTEAMMRAGK